jgi:hypothetical protein
MARHEIEERMGEDSFLDTIANLVGIMIVFVVVIGSKTNSDAQEYGRKMAEAVDVNEVLAEPVKAAQELQSAVIDQHNKLNEHILETEYRRAERNALLQQVAVARQVIDSELGSTESKKRSTIEKLQRVDELESELKKTTEQLGSSEKHSRPKIVLEHLPTPMAKTVFGKEMHIRLQRGMVSMVPWDQLISMLKANLPMAAQRNASRESIEATLGPVGGYVMRYRLMAVQGGFELDKFELETTAQNDGEPLELAMSPAGRMRLELASRNPAETVVTVWVYPDSFEAFRKLKAALFEEGFLCAARPLPDGIRIGASPRGTRSSAQ